MQIYTMLVIFVFLLFILLMFVVYSNSFIFKILFYRHIHVSLSLVFCSYQQVYDIFNMSCLGVILQVMGRDGMSTPQNGAAAYSQSHVSCIRQGDFQLPSCHMLHVFH